MRPDMALVAEGGIAGYIVGCSDRFSVCLSVLNRNFRTSGKIKGDDYFGSVYWDGTSYRHLTLSEIPKYAQIHAGDTIVTTAHSSIFPPDLTIGTVESFELNNATYYDVERGCTRHRGAEQRIGRALSTPTSAEPWSRASSRRRPNRNERKPFRSPLRSLTLASGFPGSNKPGGEKIPGSIAAESRPTATDRNARVSPERKNDGGKQTQSRNRQAGKPYTGLKKSRVSRHRASGKTRKPDEPAHKRNFYKNATKPCTARCNTRFFSS